jgi:hypothetical protein
MTRRLRTAAIITALIAVCFFTYVAAAAGHPLFLVNAYELDEL